MIIVLIGAPGAGKGTQADLLVANKGFKKISTGDALRRQVKDKTPVGLQAEAIMAKGQLVPDDVLLNILKEEMSSSKNETVILDGYPRNVAQAVTLVAIEQEHPLKVCLHLDVPREELVSRLSGRRVCSKCGASYHVTAAPSVVQGVCDKCGGNLVQRSDDEPKSVAVRLDVYEKNTQPVLDYYVKRGLYRKVSGIGSTSDIFRELVDVLDDCAG